MAAAGGAMSTTTPPLAPTSGKGTPGLGAGSGGRSSMGLSRSASTTPVLGSASSISASGVSATGSSGAPSRAPSPSLAASTAAGAGTPGSTGTPVTTAATRLVAVTTAGGAGESWASDHELTADVDHDRAPLRVSVSTGTRSAGGSRAPALMQLRVVEPLQVELPTVLTPKAEVVAAAAAAEATEVQFASPRDTDRLDDDEDEPVPVAAVLERIGLGKFQYRLFIVCGLGFMADGVEVLLLSFLQEVLRAEWNLSYLQAATLTGVVYVGELLGALVWGRLADHIGRRRCYLWSMLVLGGFGLISAASPNITWLIVFRGLVGFGIGGLGIPFDLLAEMLPNQARGRILLGYQYCWSVGAFFLTTMAWLLLDTAGWRYLMVVAALPVALAAAGAFAIVESPSFLAATKNVEGAKLILEHIAKVNQVPLGRFAVAGGPGEDKSAFRTLLKPQFMTTTLLVWTLWLAFGFTYNGVVLITPELFSTGTSTGFDYPALFASAASEVVGITCTIFFIDKWGRKRTQEVFYALAAVGTLGLAFQDISAIKLIGALTARLSTMGASSATWLHTVEIYPTTIRATGHSAANAVCRVGAFITPFVAISLRQSMWIPIGVYATINAIAAIAARLISMETTGQSLPDAIHHARFNELEDE